MKVTMANGRNKTIKIGDTIKVYYKPMGGSVPIRVSAVGPNGRVMGKLARTVTLNGQKFNASNTMSISASAADIRRGMSGR